MDLQSGAEWGVRLFMGREPTADDIAKFGASRNVEDLRARLLQDDEVRNWHRFLPDEPQPERTDLDFAEGARWAYRLALRREASEDDVRTHGESAASVSYFRSVFRSREFEQASPDAVFLADADVIRQFVPISTKLPPDDGFTNCVGAYTRVPFLHPSVSWKAGTVEGVPGLDTPGLHGLSEWVASLRSVLEARERFVAMELGAGWAPWLVSTALAAQKRGIKDIHLVGVEGSAEHYNYMVQHFLDNGLDPEQHDLLHAVVGSEDGFAYFPKLHDPTADYGANAVFSEDERDAAVQRGELERVESVSLAGLLEKTGRVDLLHMDIQGHERAVLEASMPQMNAYVHRALIGTHSRHNDAALLELFAGNGWYLEYEKPTATVQAPEGFLHFPVDGEQVWRNDYA